MYAIRSYYVPAENSISEYYFEMLLFQQVINLGVPAFGCGFNIWDTDRKFATAWMAGQDRLQPPFKTSSSQDIFLRIYESAQNGDSVITSYSIHYTKLYEMFLLECKSFSRTDAFSKHSSLFIPSYTGQNLSEKEIDTLKT